MRDMRKVKNRHVFELDNKQMVLVLAGLIVIGLLVFSAGVMVGSKTAKDKILAMSEKDDLRVKIKAPSLLEEKKIKDEASSLEKIEDVIEKTLSEGQKVTNKTKIAPSPTPGKTSMPAGLKKSSPPSVSLKKEGKANKADTHSPQEKEAWFIQVASFQSVDDANRRAKELKDRGYKVLVVKADIPGKGAWFRVRIGPFDSVDAAKSVALKVEKKEKTSTFVTKGLSPLK